MTNTTKRTDKRYRQQLISLVDEYNSNGKKTVLLTCDAFFPLVDGVVNVMDNYARLLSKDMNVLVLAPATAGRVYLRSYPVLAVRSLFSAKLNYQIALPDLDGWAKRCLRRLRIDLIHCHSPFFIGHYVLNLHKKRHIPLICTFHSQYKRDFIRYVGDGPLTKFLLKYIMEVFNGCDEVWTMHKASRDTLISYGYEGEPRLVPNGTSYAPPIDYEKERAFARARLGVGDKLTLIFVGRLVEQKNILFIAEVLGELKRRGLDFVMLFAGEGPDKEKLVKKLQEEGVSDNVIFEGRLEEDSLSRVYAAGDLQLFPSLYDVSSIVQMEAASRYTPTVFAEGSLTSCTVRDGVDGFILPCELGPFTDGILNILQDKERLSAVAEGAYRDLYFTWDDIAEKAKAAYEEVLLRAKSPDERPKAVKISEISAKSKESL